jgi:hypothetical protein
MAILTIHGKVYGIAVEFKRGLELLAQRGLILNNQDAHFLPVFPVLPVSNAVKARGRQGDQPIGPAV